MSRMIAVVISREAEHLPDIFGEILIRLPAAGRGAQQA